jgi:membrane protein YqaA with SNARE-associated domain
MITASLVGLVIGSLMGYIMGWKRGRAYGEDTQRVADIMDMWKGNWRRSQRRDVTGKFVSEK